MFDVWTATTHSPDATEALGRALFPLLPNPAFIGLYGDLAAGKTCFMRGLVAAARPGGNASSPTFTLVNEYAGMPPIYHMDLYRLESVDALIEFGAPDLFAPDSGICAVEWADRAESLLPAKRIDIFFEHAPGGRRIRIENRELLTKGWQNTLAETAISPPS